MGAYSVRGLSAATAASANQSICGLWNADSTKYIVVYEIGLSKTTAGAAGDSLYLSRTTARGTSAANSTPDGDNAWLNDGETPPSGVIMDTDYSAEPTLATPALFGWAASAVAGSGFQWPTPRGIVVKPGSGLALVSLAAVAWPASEAYWHWEE